MNLSKIKMMPLGYLCCMLVLVNTDGIHALLRIGPLCLSCNKVVQPRDCGHVTVCGEHEKCAVTKILTNSGLLWYNVGCLDINHCRAATGTHAIGSSRGSVRAVEDGITVCEICCTDGDLCNRKGCGATERPLSEGKLCFSCQQQSHVNTCDDIALCGEDQNCFIEETHFGSDVFFSTGCRAKTDCRTTRLTKCCDTELCNNNFSSDINTLQTTSTSQLPTTTSPLPSTTTSPSYNCPNPIYYESSKYCYFDSTMTLTDARSLCTRNGQHLPIIETPHEHDFLKQILEPKQVTIWLDGTDEEVESTWVWYTTGERIHYFNWSPGQPDHYFGFHRENCLELGYIYSMQWNDAPCNDNTRKNPVLCEASTEVTVPACPGNWIHRDHYMYCVMDFNGTWYDGKSKCSSLLAHLPVADTEASFRRIGDVIQHRYSIWLDGTDENQKGRWIWSSTGLDLTYTHWAPGEPNEIPHQPEHCLDVQTNFDWKWNNAPCYEVGRVQKLVCERYELILGNIIG